jgi:hypothetical protein
MFPMAEGQMTRPRFGKWGKLSLLWIFPHSFKSITVKGFGIRIQLRV